MGKLNDFGNFSMKNGLEKLKVKPCNKSQMYGMLGIYYKCKLTYRIPTNVLIRFRR